MLVALLIAVILPDDTDIEALRANRSWRVIFGLPLITYSMILLGLVFLLPYDSPKFYMAQNQRRKAIESIRRAYDTGGDA